jgi:hypothetical protein
MALPQQQMLLMIEELARLMLPVIRKSTHTEESAVKYDGLTPNNTQIFTHKLNLCESGDLARRLRGFVLPEL